MKCIFCLFLVCIIFLNVNAQNLKGKVIREQFLSTSIQGNLGGENAMRNITVYLPPGYNEGKGRYPVIYFLHGFWSNDSDYMANFKIESLLNAAIEKKLLQPVIMLLPDSYTKFKGSFYTNSALTGNWADFITKDVVQFIDKKYRTIADRNSRGICGHSMGGYGAIKLGMTKSNVFSSVYALSPARLDWGQGLTYGSERIKRVASAKTVDSILNDFFLSETANLARTFSPNVNKPPFYCDFPFSFIGDSVLVNEAVYKKWDEHFPINMIDKHVADLKSLRAFKLDWGRNEGVPFIPADALRFSKKLEGYGINHYAEEYIGDHGNKIGGMDGRIYTELLPFFNSYLKFEENVKIVPVKNKIKDNLFQ